MTVSPEAFHTLLSEKRDRRAAASHLTPRAVLPVQAAARQTAAGRSCPHLIREGIFAVCSTPPRHPRSPKREKGLAQWLDSPLA